MSLERPRYIPVDLIARDAPKHVWSDWDPYEPIGWPDETTKHSLAKVSNLAIISFMIGCSEWITYRFSNFSSDKRPYDFIEACWVFVMGKANRLPPAFKAKEWRGSIRGPIDLGLVTIKNAWDAAEDVAPIQNAAFIEQIAIHVLTTREQYFDWRNKVLSRLSEYFPRNDSNLDGPPVPREILDPTFDLNLTATHSALIKSFLGRIDYSGNPYLRRLRGTLTNSPPQ